MTFDAWSIARKRYRMRKTLRVAVVVLMTTGVAIAAAPLIQSVRSIMRGDYIASAITGLVPFMVGAGSLLLADRFLLRWLVPMPTKACPACGYAIGPVTPARCSECGLELGGQTLSASGGLGRETA